MDLPVYREQWDGYTYCVRAATKEEVASWRVTAKSMGWTIPESSPDANVGWFECESRNPMDLPYELRSTVMRPNGDVRVILAQHMQDLRERVEADIESAYRNWVLR